VDRSTTDQLMSDLLASRDNTSWNRVQTATFK